jgi:hypothetical protein
MKTKMTSRCFERRQDLWCAKQIDESTSSLFPVCKTYGAPKQIDDEAADNASVSTDATYGAAPMVWLKLWQTPVIPLFLVIPFRCFPGAGVLSSGK